MTTEPNPTEPTYRTAVNSIDFLNNPDLAGLPADFAGMGVIRGTEEGTGRRSTMLVDHDYGVLMLEARRDLEGLVSVNSNVVRWVRLGWPEEWGTDELSPTWLPVYPGADQ